MGTPAQGRVKRLVATTKRRADTARAAVEAQRPHSPSLDVTLAAFERDRRRAGWLLAGALAHRLFLWLLPFTLVLVAGLGFLESANKESPEDLAETLGIVGLASESIARAAADAEHARLFALLIGVPALYIASVGTIKAFRTVSALAWGIPAEPVRRAPLAVLGFLGLLTASFAVTVSGATVRDQSPGFGLFATLLIAIGYVWIAFTALWVLPRRSVPWTALIPGAILIGLGLQAIHLTTVYFISYRVSSSSETYGVLGVAAALLLALYLIGRLFVAGVILNTTLWERGERKHERADDERQHDLSDHRD
jgi:uncharacterized BrkB/YihY/UPF0761 family membrane protein